MFPPATSRDFVSPSPKEPFTPTTPFTPKENSQPFTPTSQAKEPFTPTTPSTTIQHPSLISTAFVVEPFDDDETIELKRKLVYMQQEQKQLRDGVEHLGQEVMLVDGKLFEQYLEYSLLESKIQAFQQQIDKLEATGLQNSQPTTPSSAMTPMSSISIKESVFA
jgi:hypothetical protein